MNDTDWLSEATSLRAWAGRCGTLIRDEVDHVHFGNQLIEVLADEVSLRLVRDRGTPVISVGWNGNWHNARKLKAFVEGLTIDAAIDEYEPSVGDLINDWQRVAEAVRSPRLIEFEAAVTRAYLARRGATPGQMGVAAE